MRLPVQALLAAALVLLLGWLGYQWIFGAGQGAELHVLAAQGQVTRAADAGRVPVEVGDRLVVGDTIQVGENGGAVIGVGELTRLTLERSSSIQVLEVTDDAVRVELENGLVSARVRQGGPSLGVGSRGRMVVSADGAFRAAVGEDGTFAVEAQAGQIGVEGVEGVAMLPEGQRLTAPVAGQPVVAATPEALLFQVAWPQPVERTATRATVQGNTAPYARVVADCGAKPCGDARAGPDGSFSVSVPIDQDDNPVSLRAEDPMGERAESRGDVKREQPPPTTSAEVVWGR